MIIGFAEGCVLGKTEGEYDDKDEGFPEGDKLISAVGLDVGVAVVCFSVGFEVGAVVRGTDGGALTV